MGGVAVPFTNLDIRQFTANAIGCSAGTPYPANYFDNAVALISRGTCAFTEEVANAAAAGADHVIIYNNTFGSINMNTDGATIPGLQHFAGGRQFDERIHHQQRGNADHLQPGCEYCRRGNRIWPTSRFPWSDTGSRG